MESEVKITHKLQGQTLGIAGGNYRVVVSGEETDNKFAVIEMVVPPGGGPPPHSHPDIQETFYVLEGQIDFKTETGKTVLTHGDFVNVPFGGAIHCFKNNTESPVKLLCTVMPAGLEKLFATIGIPAKLGEFFPVPELTEDYKKLLKQLDQDFNQTTYPPTYLD